jgi:hypothetical protein
MRGIDLVAVQCVAGVMAFACLGQSDDDDDPAAGGSGGRTNQGGSGDEGGATPEPTGGNAGGTAGQAGTMDICCVDNQTTTCFCPAGSSCNFGWFTDFYPDGTCCAQGDATCSNGGSGGAGGTDTGGTAGDATTGGNVSGGTSGSGPVGGEAGAGTWEQCCEDGRTSQCLCPAGSVCNFGMDVEFLPGRRCCYTLDGDEHSCNAGGGGAGGGGAGGSGGVSP